MKDMVNEDTESSATEPKLVIPTITVVSLIYLYWAYSHPINPRLIPPSITRGNDAHDKLVATRIGRCRCSDSPVWTASILQRRRCLAGFCLYRLQRLAVVPEAFFCSETDPGSNGATKHWAVLQCVQLPHDHKREESTITVPA